MFGPDEKEKKESKPLEKIQLKHLIIAFLILGVGCFVALIVFMIEMIGNKRSMKLCRPITAKIKIWEVSKPIEK